MKKVMNREELIEYVLGHPFCKERRVPGTYLVEDREYRYASNKRQVKFDKLFHELFNVPPVICGNGGALMKDVRLLCPMVAYLRQFLIRGILKGGGSSLNRELRR